MSVQATRSLACGRAASNTNALGIRSATTATPTIKYVADTSAALRTLDIGALSSALSNTDVSIVLTDDGRLSGINSSATGQGAEIIKAAVALATTLAAFGLDGGGPTPAQIAAACAAIAKVGTNGVVSLVYSAELDFSDKKDHQHQLAIEPASSAILERLRTEMADVEQVIRPVCVSVEGHGTGRPLPFVPPQGQPWSPSSFVLLDLVQPSLASVKVFGGTQGCAGPVASEMRVLVPQAGTRYQLPIPTPPVFGKQTFKLALSEAGAVTTLGYGSDSGVSSALIAAGSIATAAQPQATAARAAEIKAEGDIIAQQQRLLRCQNDPKACT